MFDLPPTARQNAMPEGALSYLEFCLTIHLPEVGIEGFASKIDEAVVAGPPG